MPLRFICSERTASRGTAESFRRIAWRPWGRCSRGRLQPLLDGVLEEVVAACLRYVASAQEDPDAFLTGAGKQLAGFFPGDFRRVETILQRTGS